MLEWAQAVNEQQAILDQPKAAHRWTGLKARTNHVGHLIGVADLVDAQGITLPGYTLQIEVKAPADTARCLYLFSIMRLLHGKRVRVYQLEVAPRSKRTHNGAHPLFGPHEHLGDAEPTAVEDARVDCADWNGALQWFFVRTQVRPFEIPDPNHA